MSQLSDQQIRDELLKVHDKVKELTGYEMYLFRPPYGDYDNHVIKNVAECGYLSIQWDVDSLDWKDYGVESIIRTVCDHKHLGPGSIILCHNGAKYTAQALDAMLTGLKADGYEIVPVSQLVHKENYHMNHEGRQIPDR
jgi:peptidoglycan/xylan/chitin deacetylase (PgdA/CDA1 family)